MEIATIQGETRTAGGRHANQRLRRGGLVPAVIYGHEQAPETVALSRRDLDDALAHGHHVVRLKVADQETQYLLKAVQYDHLQRDPIHVDLMRVDPSERVEVKVRIELRGTPVGMKQGGVLVRLVSDLDVECPLLQIPDVIRASIDHLGMNEGLHFRDLALPDGVVLRHDPDDLVVVVRPARVETEAVPGLEGGAEPEVISRGKAEDAEGGEA
jgi:large subunit ribosomal protein L25